MADILGDLKKKFGSYDKLPDPIENAIQSAPQQYQGQFRKGARTLMTPLNVIDGAMDAANYMSTIVTGTLISATAARDIAAGNQTEDRTAFEAAQAQGGNPLETAREVNQEYAKKHPMVTGALNLLTDPTNFITPAGREAGIVAEAPQQFGRAVGALDTLRDYGGAVKATGKALKLAHEEGKVAQARALAGEVTTSVPKEIGNKGKKGTRVVELPDGTIVQKGQMWGPNTTQEITDLENQIAQWKAKTANQTPVSLTNTGAGTIPGSFVSAKNATGGSLKGLNYKLYFAKKRAGWTKVDDGFLDQLAAMPGSTELNTAVASTKQTITEEVTKSARKPLTPGSFVTNWMQQAVVTPRTLIQDAGTLLAWGKERGLSGREMARAWTSMVDEATIKSKALTPEQAIYEALPTRTQALFNHYGWHADQTKLINDWGMSFLEASTDIKKELAPYQSMVMEASLPSLTGVVDKVPVLGNAIGAISGWYRAYQNAAYRAFNHFQHAAARSVGFEAGFGKRIATEAESFLARAEKVDPQAAQAIRQKGVNFWNRRVYADMQEMDGYVPESLFTPADVAEAFGADSPFVKQWQQALDVAAEDGNRMAKTTFGDFSHETGGDSKGGALKSAVVPFLSYPKIAYPRTIQMMMDNPSGALVIYHLVSAAQERANAEGLPGYASAGITIKDTDPALGLIARVMNGGREGSTTIKPLGLLSPAGSLADVPDIRQSDKPFDKLDKILGTALPSFSPFVKTPAYLMGFSDQTPGNMSRIQGIENAMPGPTLGTARGYLDAERKVIGQSAPYDPIENMAKELVYTRTGKPLEDPSNVDLAVEIAQKTGIYEDAKNIYNQQGAVRNAVGLVNPTDVVNVSEVSAQSRQAKAGMISSDVKARLAKIDPALAVYVDQVNADVATVNPAADVYKDADKTVVKAAQKDQRLIEWEDKHKGLRANAPRTYAKERDAFIKANGIKELGK
jgi:hypothetical protein